MSGVTEFLVRPARHFENKPSAGGQVFVSEPNPVVRSAIQADTVDILVVR
jgi:hypothetical protein